MSTSDNPLMNMTGAMNPDAGDEAFPREMLRDTALPGFKLALEARRSIRVLNREPIPQDVMRDCLRGATLAPSSSKLQPYELYWVRNSATRRELADACLSQRPAANAP